MNHLDICGQMNEKSWYSNWFDSPYYPMLYSHRSDEEAEYFLEKLMTVLSMRPGERVLDLACGRGRHSRYLHQKGMKVTGLDLSPASIKEALKFEAKDIEFCVADMRSFHFDYKFDWILNLFTSFGYFETIAENLEVLHSVNAHLQKSGTFILDFLDLDCVRKNLVPTETIVRDHVEFHLNRSIESGFVFKRIKVIDAGNTYEFEERVQALDKKQLMEMLNAAGLTLIRTFGDYNLNIHRPGISARLILLAVKN